MLTFSSNRGQRNGSTIEIRRLRFPHQSAHHRPSGKQFPMWKKMQNRKFHWGEKKKETRGGERTRIWWRHLRLQQRISSLFRLRESCWGFRTESNSAMFAKRFFQKAAQQLHQHQNEQKHAQSQSPRVLSLFSLMIWFCFASGFRFQWKGTESYVIEIHFWWVDPSVLTSCELVLAFDLTTKTLEVNLICRLWIVSK